MEDPNIKLEAEKLKNKGNDAFKKQSFQEAINYYSEAIDTLSNEPAYYTNRAIAYLKVDNFDLAMNDCKKALDINPKFAKAYNRMSKCHIALGDLKAASIILQRSIELEPDNAVNKKDQKALNDLKIIQSLIDKAITEEKYDKAVTNLNAILQECTQSIQHICLKIECLMKDYQFDEANKYSATLQKTSGACIYNNPKFLMWRGKVLIYIGNEIAGKKHLTQAMQFDPDLKECQKYIKSCRHSAEAKERAAEIFKAGNFPEAITAFEECLAMDSLNMHYNSTLLLNIAIA